METIGYYADMLYVSHAWWREKSREKFREYTDKTFLNRSRLVKNYIIPIWGVYKPEELTPKKINDPLKNIVGVISKMPLSGWTKNQVLRCLSNIYIYLIEEDIIDKNPVGSVMRFSCRQSRKRGAIPIPQMATLFPENHEELLRIWRTQRYICAFLVLRDTGLRPGELVALKWSDWYPEKRFFPILRAIESGTKNREKETKTGMAKPAIVTELTRFELEILKKQAKQESEHYIFAGIKNNYPYNVPRLCHAFREGVKRAGLDHPEYTPYWLRHTFNTRSLENLPDEVVRRLMGHSSEAMTRYYRDADIASLMREAETIRQHLDKLKH